MTNKKKLSIIAAIILTIGIIGSLLTYRMISLEPISEEKVINHHQVSIIDINTDNTRINLYPTTDDSIKVILEGEATTNIKTSFTTDVKDSTLFITYSEKQRSWFNFDIFHGLKGVNLTVYLPEKQYESIQAFSKNGRISAEKLNSKQIGLKTNNGRIELKDVDSLKITAESNNGKINAKDIIAENIFVKTDNGGITLAQIEGEIEGRTMNGSISLITETLEQNMNLKSSNGKITIETAKEPTNVQFNITTINGKANILDQHQGSTTIGNGENLIELATQNGNISVTKE